MFYKEFGPITESKRVQSGTRHYYSSLEEIVRFNAKGARSLCSLIIPYILSRVSFRQVLPVTSVDEILL
jgi:hypothetical protein